MAEQINVDAMNEADSPAPRSFFDRLSGVYFSPAEAFREIGTSPRVLVPIAVVIIIGLIVGVCLTQKLDLASMLSDQFARQASQGQMSAAQQEQLQRQMAIVSRVIGIFILVLAAISSLILSLVVAALFKLVSAMIGAENEFKAVFAVTLYSILATSIISSAIFVLVLLIKDPRDITFQNMNSLVSSNLGSVIALLAGEDALPKFLMGLARSVDLFAIWIIALLAIGYSAVSKKLRTSTAATWLVVCYAVVAVIGALVGSLR
jgi:hypothetical protein